MQTIFLSAAHSSGSPLPELLNEVREIRRELRPLEKRNIWELEENRAANLDDIFEAFSESAPNIHVFHYAGHANQEELSIEKGGNIKGIAGLFGISVPEGTNKNPLSFIFLNGCATKGQVKYLHNVGVAAIIATSRKIGDLTAKEFAVQFYKTWAIEGKSLKDAFETAKSYIISFPATKNKRVESDGSSVLEEDNNDIPWGLYPHPDFKSQILEMQINPTPKLPPQILGNVRTKASESILELVYEFEQYEPAELADSNEDKDPLLTLITRLPWTIGTHLRRLFAIEDTKSMSEPGLERLRELVSSYTELTRFISYISLSILWDRLQTNNFDKKRLLKLDLVSNEDDVQSIDYVWRLRQYFSLQKEAPGDLSTIENYIEDFLKTVDEELSESYLFIEELKQALAPKGDVARLQELVLLRTGTSEGISELCLQTETIFTQFLKASLWLTKFRLFTVRSIMVDKIRYMEMKQPYIHKTMTLHAAFSDIKLLSTKREIASDNSCILLAPIQSAGSDPLAGAINLSPFYIDKSAYLENSLTHYPAVYVLKSAGENDEFIYEYLDGDVNYNYQFGEDHRLVIKKIGAIFPPALKIDLRDSRRFGIVHKQLLKLQKDFEKV